MKERTGNRRSITSERIKGRHGRKSKPLPSDPQFAAPARELNKIGADGDALRPMSLLPCVESSTAESVDYHFKEIGSASKKLDRLLQPSLQTAQRSPLKEQEYHGLMKQKKDRRICPIQLAGWFGKSQKPALNNAQYAIIANSLNGLVWPEDPDPAPKPSGSSNLGTGCRPYFAKYRDFTKVANAAKVLMQSLAVVAAHWERQDEGHDPKGSEILQNLRNVLREAMPYIEFPFGKPENRFRVVQKTWQLWLLIIVPLLIDALSKAGHSKVSVSRYSVVVRVAWEVMIVMNVEGVKTVTPSGVSAFLIRFDRSNGLTPQGVEALTTR